MAEMLLESKSEGCDEVSNEITLRPIALSDIEDFMVWATDARVSHFCVWDTYTSKHEAFQFINDVAIPHPWFRVICINDRAIGSISVTPDSGMKEARKEGKTSAKITLTVGFLCKFYGEGRRGELGYVLAFEHWGKEIATRAVKMVASSIFKEWPELERLQAIVDVENKGSQRVLEKAGFSREGVLRKYLTIKGRCSDMVMFSILSGDLVA